jgi:hypothetical protein
MTPHGELTTKLAEMISPYWKDRGFKLLHDHGRAPSMENIGKIVSTLNQEYKNGDELSQLDIAIVNQDTNQIAILLEIEETTDKPKTFLGDIFGVLIGQHIFFKRNELLVGPATILVVVGINPTNHPDRNDHIQNQVNKIKSNLATRNARLEKVVVITYPNEAALFEQLPPLLEKLAR